jgi:hypothetical protein
MKKLILIMIILSSALVFGQSWNTTVTTTIEEGSIDKFDSFTNRDGIHIVIKIPNDDIVYYRLDSEGNEEEDATITTSGDYPSIAGTEDKVFVFYRDGSYIKGKYSTNAGSSWTALDDISTTSSDCNGIDAVYDDAVGGIHIVWGLQDGSKSNYESYYSLLDVQTLEYGSDKTVTDYTGEVGGNPSVAFSEDRVHVSYNKGYWNPPSSGFLVSTRDRDDGTWENPLNAMSG